jgi:hypothetical protein
MSTSVRRWPALVGVIAILASEFLLRDLFLPMPASPRQIALIAVLEWVVLLLLVEFWLGALAVALPLDRRGRFPDRLCRLGARRAGPGGGRAGVAPHAAAVAQAP